jgi:hypothetical protein
MPESDHDTGACQQIKTASKYGKIRSQNSTAYPPWKVPAKPVKK